MTFADSAASLSKEPGIELQVENDICAASGVQWNPRHEGEH